MKQNRSHDPTERSLVRALERREDGALESFVRLHAGSMLATARRFSRREQHARDIVNEAIHEASVRLHTRDETVSLSAWLRRLTLEASIRHARLQGGGSTDSIEQYLPTFTDDGRWSGPVPRWPRGIGDSAQHVRVRAAILNAIDRLPEPYRTALLLRNAEGLGIAESAKLLGVDECTVERRLHAAHCALVTVLGPIVGARSPDDPSAG